jgi:hypothetical protein
VGRWLDDHSNLVEVPAPGLRRHLEAQRLRDGRTVKYDVLKLARGYRNSPQQERGAGLPDVSLSSSSIRIGPGRSSPLRMVDAYSVAAIAGDWRGQRLMSFHRQLTMIS